MWLSTIIVTVALCGAAARADVEMRSRTRHAREPVRGPSLPAGPYGVAGG